MSMMIVVNHKVYGCLVQSQSLVQFAAQITELLEHAQSTLSEVAKDWLKFWKVCIFDISLSHQFWTDLCLIHLSKMYQ